MGTPSAGPHRSLLRWGARYGFRWGACGRRAGVVGDLAVVAAEPEQRDQLVEDHAVGIRGRWQPRGETPVAGVDGRSTGLTAVRGSMMGRQASALRWSWTCGDVVTTNGSDGCLATSRCRLSAQPLREARSGASRRTAVGASTPAEPRKSPGNQPAWGWRRSGGWSGPRSWVDLFRQPGEGERCLRLLPGRFLGLTGVAVLPGEVRQHRGSPERWFEGPIHLHTQAPDLGEVVRLAERSTVPGEETFHGFLGRLLAVKDRPSQQGRGRGQIMLGLAQVVDSADEPRPRLSHELRVMPHGALFLPAAQSLATSRQPGPDARTVTSSRQ